MQGCLLSVHVKRCGFYQGATFKAGRNTVTLEVLKRVFPLLCEGPVRSGLGCDSGPGLGHEEVVGPTADGGADRKTARCVWDVMDCQCAASVLMSQSLCL